MLNTLASFTSFVIASAVLDSVIAGPVFLSPVQDIILPSSDTATSPLTQLGANSPWFAGPNISGESNDIPEGCTIENAAYVVRHGSRYPDSGAYAEWTALYTKIQSSSFTASGPLSFLASWKPVLTNPTLQIAKESPTGYKEAFDLGYRLRTRYPSLYEVGSPFIAWANLVPRVVETAQNFVRGFLGAQASVLGSVITVNSTGSADAVFNSLGPSDQCPAFKDGNGGSNLTTWNSIYLPPILARLSPFITGNLTLTTSDLSIFPYLCGFESQITGTLSPWCNIFTDAELLQYSYAQDLRYYYGIGDGTDLQSKMMLPFLHSLVTRLALGKGQKGVNAKGEEFKVPDLLTLFLNDGQLVELVAATDVMADAEVLDGNRLPGPEWKYRASRFVSMRGTVAFENLKCLSGNYIRVLLNDAVYPHPLCANGPGKSCETGKYVKLVASKLSQAGDLRAKCGIKSVSGNGTFGDGSARVAGKGAGFVGDLRGGWLGSVVP
ncbi:Phosphoglycerate mutase-like protein [Glarea lozoyensis ATCC 20868]|uniref:3-phytase n=1 Tax=Glarea lozoyensis (strain ATCC 20868 / MF5171) TaxID=1116229 RepID=S3D7X0_GLAL2|nr:Phosphoglycerate mutase-like protein [Glarea lozoyensis ATCC 20868]EPE34607.1 Phosphoglycerate mutase-like protein [Glarea lozoyensis ATCC 20868]